MTNERATRPDPTDVNGKFHLVCVSTFPAGTGFAWKFIRRTWVGIASRGALRGIRTAIVFPRPVVVDEVPVSPAVPLVRSGSTRLASYFSLLKIVAAARARILYLSEGAPLSVAYPLLRLVGVRRIVVHDHTSGSRSKPRRIKRFAKSLAFKLPWLGADIIIAISDYVARRQIEVALVPPGRVRRVWNAVELPEARESVGRLRDELGISEDCHIVMCVGRATEEKGIHILLTAFDQLQTGMDSVTMASAHLVVVGDGPMLPELRRMRENMQARDRTHLLGYRDDVRSLVGDADVCVVPSLWEEGFGLTAIEAMVMEKPVVASSVGALPEIVTDRVTGLLVPAGDPDEIAIALRELLANPALRQLLGRAGRQRVEQDFEFETYADMITAILLEEPAGMETESTRE